MYTEPMFYSVNDFPGANKYISNVYQSLLIVTQGRLSSILHFFSFASDITGSYEIYVNHDMWDTVFLIYQTTQV